MKNKLSQILTTLNSIVLGKQQQTKIALACILANGHLLLEDLPGMGKTTLSHAIASALGLKFQRIQFTSDILPGDILGASIFDSKTSSFTFHEGPIFSETILADEINRASPKSQSALLEAMEERQVTIDGQTRNLPEPFFVIATQNPLSSSGTFVLPESQLDRFLMRMSIGYPDADAEKQLLQGNNSRIDASSIEPILNKTQLLDIQEKARNISTSSVLIDYVLRIVQTTRSSGKFAQGLSPRGSIAIIQAAKAIALLEDRDYVIPDDIREILPYVVSHRIRASSGNNEQELIEYLLKEIPILE